MSAASSVGGMQGDLFAPPAWAVPKARSKDPRTSHQAAESARELAARHHRLILEALAEHGPSGKDRIGMLTSMSGVQVCRRLTELERAGRIEPTGRNVTSNAGRAEREWRLARTPS